MTKFVVNRLAAGLVLVVVAAGGAGCTVASGQAAGPAAEPSSISGKQLYAACSSCHGNVGEGNAVIGAPKIASDPAWYVAGQLTRFQQGLRGKHPDDLEGLKMRAMARQMLSDAEVKAVAGYVAGLAPIRKSPTLTHADAAKGQAMFPMCAACHGLSGEGNEALNAPHLAGLEDWYVARQLRKFKTGVRGASAGDTIGPIMAPMANTVPDDQIDNVAAYVQSLGK
jgi:cytochrome c553